MDDQRPPTDKDAKVSKSQTSVVILSKLFEKDKKKSLKENFLKEEKAAFPSSPYSQQSGNSKAFVIKSTSFQKASSDRDSLNGYQSELSKPYHLSSSNQKLSTNNVPNLTSKRSNVDSTNHISIRPKPLHKQITSNSSTQCKTEKTPTPKHNNHYFTKNSPQSLIVGSPTSNKSKSIDKSGLSSSKVNGLNLKIRSNICEAGFLKSLKNQQPKLVMNITEKPPKIEKISLSKSSVSGSKKPVLVAKNETLASYERGNQFVSTINAFKRPSIHEIDAVTMRSPSRRSDEKPADVYFSSVNREQERKSGKLHLPSISPQVSPQRVSSRAFFQNFTIDIANFSQNDTAAIEQQNSRTGQTLKPQKVEVEEKPTQETPTEKEPCIVDNYPLLIHWSQYETEKTPNIYSMYTFTKLIEQGAFAKVYQAYDMNIKLAVAVKVIDKQKMIQRNLKRMVERELEIFSSQSHPSIL